MAVDSQASRASIVQSEWYRALAAYEKPSALRAVGQILDSFLPYLATMGAMMYIVAKGLPYLYALALAPLAAGFLVRIFIIFHDCGHGSFFRSRRANQIVGYFAGLLTFTPFDHWRHLHAEHHASAGDLDRRGAGDIWTMTVAEYRAASFWQKLGYRLYRHPLILLLIGPPYIFLIGQRFPNRGEDGRERTSVTLTNLGLAAILCLAWFTVGLKTYFLAQMPIIVIASAAGVWLFYVQHQYEDVYWDHHPDWDPIRAALQGSSYYRLPKLFQWFSGNIGLHHIHHLRPRIPNYNLQRCYDEVPEMRMVTPLTFLKSLQCLNMHLWDEKSRSLISFRAARAALADSSSRN